jgi:hypothetical protein
MFASAGNRLRSSVPFIQPDRGAVPRSVRAKLREFVSVTDFGAVGDDATDCTAAFLNAYDAVVAKGGGRIFIPIGFYRVSSLPVVAANDVWWQGEGDGDHGSVIRWTGSATANCLVFNLVQHSGIRDVNFRPTVRRTAGFTIVFQGGSFKCRAENVRIDYDCNGILIDGATETRLLGTFMLHLLGARGIQYGGGASKNFRCVIDDFIADNPYPLPHGAVRTWAQSTAFTAGEIVLSNGNIYQCSTSGTSAAVGTGPAGFPSGSTPESVFTGTIADGAAAWKFVSSDLKWIFHDSNAYSLVIEKAGCINGNAGYWMDDAINSGTSYPIWAFINDLECDHSFAANVVLNRGEGIYANGSWWGSCLNGNGCLITATFRGEVAVTTTRIAHALQNGVSLSAGPVDVLFDGNIIGDNSQAGSAQFHGISVGAGASRFQITNNRIGDIVGTAGNPQGFGVMVAAGASNDYQIAGNCVTGNVSGGISDGGTGNAARVRDNIGHNPIGASAITVGASPFTYTAGHMPETVYVQGGTVSNIQHNGVTVFAQTNATIHLEPNETVTVTYSATPAMNRMRH